jgi:hypothetical protein
MTLEPTLHSLLLADHVYRDAGTGKYVIAGTFHHIDAPELPATLGRPTAIFMSLSCVADGTDLSIEWVDAVSGEVQLRSPGLRVASDGLEEPVQLAVETPPLPLPRAGRFLLRVALDGAVLGTLPVSVRAIGQSA